MAYAPPIYLDYNATTPLHPEVIDIIATSSHAFGNPSSSHYYGQQAKKIIDTGREQVAGLLGCPTENVILLSGGSESVNYAIKGTVFADGPEARGKHVITSCIEHPVVNEVCDYLENHHGVSVTRLPVNSEGLVDVQDVSAAIRPETVLVTIMLANNEIGTLQPIQEISKVCRERNVRLHTDASQAVGKVSVSVTGTSVDALDVDMLTVAGHKLYGPKGVGALYFRDGITLGKLIHGAGHESGRRAGTENTILIAALGKACAVAARDMDDCIHHSATLRDLLQTRLLSMFPKARVNGHPVQRLPNTLSISFPGVDASAVLKEMEPLLAASAGAACHSGEVKMSHVLQAIGLPVKYAMGTLRLSVGRMTTDDEIHRAVEIIGNAVTKLST